MSRLLPMALVAATMSSSVHTQEAVVKLTPDHQPLVEAFNAASDRPRLVTILSPT